RCCLFGRKSSAVIRDDDSGFQADELCGDLGGALRAAFRPTILDCDRATLAPSELTQSCRECGRPQAPVRRVRSQEADHWQPGGLLRARRERPRCGRAAEQRDELAPFHCLMSPVRPTERIAHLGGAADLLRCGISTWSLSAWGHKQTSRGPLAMSAFHRERT